MTQQIEWQDYDWDAVVADELTLKLHDAEDNIVRNIQHAIVTQDVDAIRQLFHDLNNYVSIYTVYTRHQSPNSDYYSCAFEAYSRLQEMVDDTTFSRLGDLIVAGCELNNTNPNYTLAAWYNVRYYVRQTDHSVDMWEVVDEWWSRREVGGEDLVEYLSELDAWVIEYASQWTMSHQQAFQQLVSGSGAESWAVAQMVDCIPYPDSKPFEKLQASALKTHFNFNK